MVWCASGDLVVYCGGQADELERACRRRWPLSPTGQSAILLFTELDERDPPSVPQLALW